MAAKNDVEGITAGIAGLSLGITVLSWNINGSTNKGNADTRRRMIPSVVKDINPDVMLLQETKHEIIPYIFKYTDSRRLYMLERAEDAEQAQVLYDEKKFEKVYPSTVKLYEILKKMFPDEDTMELRNKKVTVRSVISKRICIAHLRHKLTKCEFIFVSYHNIRKGGGPGAVREKASQVCQIIAKIHESSKCCVVAGVDFNCSDFIPTGVRVLPYDATPRRKGKVRVDFIVLDKEWPMNYSMRAVDLFGAPDYKEDQTLFTKYNQALDHDPLILCFSSRQSQEQDSSDTSSH